MTVLSSFGYCRIGSVQSARAPISRMRRLTTSDSTGRRMKMSVKAMAVPPLLGLDRGRGRKRVGIAQGDARPVGELQLPGACHALARLEAALDHHLVIEMGARLDEV